MLRFGPEHGTQKMRYAVAEDGALYGIKPVFAGSGDRFRRIGSEWFLVDSTERPEHLVSDKAVKDAAIAHNERRLSGGR